MSWKANVVAALLVGALVAGTTLLLGSAVWWLWGMCTLVTASVGLAAVQIASEAQ